MEYSIEINDTIVSNLGINLTEFILLFSIHYNLDIHLDYNYIDTNKLLDKKLIVLKKNVPLIVNKGKQLFNKRINSNLNTQELSIKYRELFPKGIKSGGFPVKSNLKEIEDKFERFFKKYMYTSEVILEGTKIYLDEKRRNNWSYLSTAKHFIIKKKLDGEVSELATYCDHYLEKGEEINNQKDKTQIEVKDF